jgi:uncharacterized membrane protein YkoI
MRQRLLFAVIGLAIAPALSSQAVSAQPAAPAAAVAPPQGDSLGADWREQQNEARDTVRDGRHLPLEKVIAIVRKRTPGRLLDTGLERDPEGHQVYRVRWAAASGRRIDFLVDAQTGAIVATQGR